MKDGKKGKKKKKACHSRLASEYCLNDSHQQAKGCNWRRQVDVDALRDLGGVRRSEEREYLGHAESVEGEGERKASLLSNRD